MEGASVSLRQVSMRFDGRRVATPALEAVDLEVEAGSFVALVGPSGCGKSTILNLVAGLLDPDGGAILVDGRRHEGTGPDRLMVFQEGALFPWLDVEGNIGFGLKRAGLPAAQRAERVAEALRLVDLGRFAHSRIHELSGGMRQRVALARALVMQPKVLLMDEPLANLDAQNREDLQQKIEELWLARRTTVLFVTHDVTEAAYLADRVVVLSHRPGTVRGVIPVPAARPRSRTDPAVEAAADAARTLLSDEFRWQKRQEMEGERAA